MNVFAYCAASFARSVRRAAGVEPLLCPPARFDQIDPTWLEGFDLLYFKLHGLPSQPFWYGDGWQTALSDDVIRAANLSGAVVFVANCWLPESPMLQALLDAGARAVIGGSGPNYARLAGIDGADLLGLWFRMGMQVGMSVQFAFRFAQHRLRLKRGPAAEDTLGFQLWEAARATSS